jgi:hypothetical protein
MASIERMVQSLQEDSSVADMKAVKPIKSDLDIAVEKELKARQAIAERLEKEAESSGHFIGRKHVCLWPKAGEEGDRWKCGCGRKYELKSIRRGIYSYDRNKVTYNWKPISGAKMVNPSLNYRVTLAVYFFFVVASFCLFGAMTLFVRPEWITAVILSIVSHGLVFLVAKLD